MDSSSVGKGGYSGGYKYVKWEEGLWTIVVETYQPKILIQALWNPCSTSESPRTPQGTV